MAELVIAPAQLDECRDVARIHVDAWRAAYAGIVDPAYLADLSIERREAMWRQSVESGRPQLLVAKRGSRIMGWVALGACRDDDAPPARGEIWALYIDPAAWSGGIGRALLDRALQRLADTSHASVSLWVMCENARAVRFYEAAGFAREPPSEREFELGQQRVREVRYVRSVAASD